VAKESDAAAGGLLPGDVVIEANRKPTPGFKELRAALAESRDSLLLRVFRNGQEFYVAIE